MLSLVVLSAENVPPTMSVHFMTDSQPPSPGPGAANGIVLMTDETTPAGTYTVTITADSGDCQRHVAIDLIVRPADYFPTDDDDDGGLSSGGDTGGDAESGDGGKSGGGGGNNNPTP